MEELPAPVKAPRSRRVFMADVVLGVGTGLGLGSLAFRFLEYLYPVVRPIKLVEIPAGAVNDIPPDGVRFMQLPGGPVMLLGKNEQRSSRLVRHLHTPGLHHPMACGRKAIHLSLSWWKV